MKKYSSIIFLLLFFNLSYPQTVFDYFNTSRFGRPIGLGNSFIGIAEGVETTFYNSAGLPHIDYYGLAYSHGNGTQFIFLGPNPFDIALVIPYFKNIGCFAFSSHHLNFDDINNKNSMYRLHYSRFITDNLTLGSSINYYYQELDLSFYGDETIKSSHTFDLSISALFSKTNLIFSNKRDAVKIGFQFNNIFASEVERLFEVTTTKPTSNLIQYFGIGFSYKYIFEIEKIKNLTPLSFLIASDFIFDNSVKHNKYKFDRLNPNFGLELLILEIIFLRFGRENDINLSDVEYTTPQYPVSRYGLGISLPLHQIFKSKNELFILFDYGYSDWFHEEAFATVEDRLKSSYSIQIRTKF